MKIHSVIALLLFCTSILNAQDKTVKIADNHDNITLSVMDEDQSPYGGTPHAIPGTIEFEDFDIGGEGIAYHDETTANEGGQYRTDEGVDIENCGEGGYNIGWVQIGEWFEYTVNVESPGDYTLNVRYASPYRDDASVIVHYGDALSKTIDLPRTSGGLHDYETAGALVYLESGEQVLKLEIGQLDMNLNNFSLSRGWIKYGVSVVVKDALNNLMSDVTIFTDDKTYLTDQNGYAKLDSMSENTSMDLKIVKQGYQQVLTAVGGNEHHELNITLEDLEQIITTEEPKVILFTPTHPDDELFGACVSFTKYCKMMGHKGYYIGTEMGAYNYTTPASDWGGSVRRDELERSANFVGADTRWMGQKDRLSSVTKIKERMCRIIRELQPDIVITHASNGEYGHGDHVNTTQGVTAAIEAAADSTQYTDQLTEGLTVWDTPKFYRQVADYNGWGSGESITLKVSGLNGPYEELNNMTMREYAVDAMEKSHYTAVQQFGGFDWKNTYPVPNEHSLHLVRLAGGGTVPSTENDLLDGLSDERLQNYTNINGTDWIILGPFSGDINSEPILNEASIQPSVGETMGEKTWADYSIPSFNLDTETPLDNRGMENKSNLDLKEYFGYIPEFASNKVAYAYTKVNVTSDTTAVLGIMAHDFYRLYVNGLLVKSDTSMIRAYDYDDRVLVNLNAGDNHIVLKIASGSAHSVTGGNVPAYYGTPHASRTDVASPWAFSVKVIWNNYSGTSTTILDKDYDLNKQFNGFKLYPNPTSGHVNIELEDALNEMIRIYDIRGKELYSANISGQRITLNLNDWNKGIYFVKVGNMMEKLIIR